MRFIFFILLIHCSLVDSLAQKVRVKTIDNLELSNQLKRYPNSLNRREFSIYKGNWKKVDIPFQFVNNLMIVDVTLDKTFPLKFLFDTGAQHTVLTERGFVELLGKPFEREFDLYGADMAAEIKAYLVRDIHLKIDRLNIPRQSILVLQEDYFKFGEIAGVQVHGIIGASLFRQFVVQIDYQRRLLTLFRPGRVKIGKQWEQMPMEVFRGKPFVDVSINMIGTKDQQVKLLLDTGASIPLLLYTETDTTLTVPPNAIKGNVGRGLGGNLEGFQGRIKELDIDQFQLGQVTTNFQKLDSVYIYDSSLLNDRNGIVGNIVLSRFHVILDYWNEQLYLRPNKFFKTDFKFDRSGLVIVASGPRLNTYNVQYIHPNSPAEQAGIQVGDIIKSINGTPTSLLSLEMMVNILQKKVGKRIRLSLLREGTRLKKEFLLEDLI